MTTSDNPSVMLIDDVRSFRDGRTCLVARTTEAAVAILKRTADTALGELGCAALGDAEEARWLLWPAGSKRRETKGIARKW